MTQARWILVALLAMCISLPCEAQRVRISVFGLFHPRRVVVTARPGKPLTIKVGDSEITLRDGQSVSLLANGQDAFVRAPAFQARVKQISVMAHGGGDSDFILAVPGRIERIYHGQLVLLNAGGELVPVVVMDVEAAVESILDAELTRDVPMEALKAQAIVTRSYLLAGGSRHEHSDFCDTTHCQFLRTPPAPKNPASVATAQTRGLVLAWRGTPFPAMYSARCGGATRTLAEVGLTAHDYPYFAVECRYCQRSPQRWSSVLREQDAAGVGSSRTEASRIQTGRRLGWSAVPSNSYSARHQNGEVILEGAGAGHGVGLCQFGAEGMARDGYNFRHILAHYFPNTAIQSAASLSTR